MRVLVVDDDKELAESLAGGLSSEEGPDGRQYEVSTCRAATQAIDLLNREYFDAVITDMRLPDGEGLDIVRTLAGKSTTTIVLTAWPTYENCVAAMRAGAWDYVSKLEEDALHRVLDSLREAYRYRAAHPDAGRVDPDAKWVHEHLGELMDSYAGELVAVRHGKILDHDKTYGTLVERVREKHPIAQPMIVSIPDMKVEAVE
jgi:DNA-binding NtrC family response regulator